MPPNVEPLAEKLAASGSVGLVPSTRLIVKPDGTEGAVYKTAYGCYLHGSLLPKNPRLADLLLSQALRRRHGDVELAPLHDSLEAQAHASATRRARETH